MIIKNGNTQFKKKIFIIGFLIISLFLYLNLNKDLSKEIIYYSKEINSNNSGNKRSEFAYSFYIRNENNFCSALIISNNIRKWSKNDIVIHLIVDDDNNDNNNNDDKKENDEILYSDETMKNFMKLENIYFRFVSNLIVNDIVKSYDWNKLWVFKLIDYKRVIYLDTNVYLKKNIDHLFQIPDESTIAMPRAYWLEQKAQIKSSTSLIVLKPSNQLFNNIINYCNTIINDHNGIDDIHNMDYINSMFINNAELMLLPGIYALLHNEFSSYEKQWLTENIHSTWENAYLFFYSSWYPWNIKNDRHYLFEKHGELFKKTWSIWYDSKNNLCKH